MWLLSKRGLGPPTPGKILQSFWSVPKCGGFAHPPLRADAQAQQLPAQREPSSAAPMLADARSVPGSAHWFVLQKWFWRWTPERGRAVNPTLCASLTLTMCKPGLAFCVRWPLLLAARAVKSIPPRAPKRPLYLAHGLVSDSRFGPGTSGTRDANPT
eukprot:scaffold1328_cov394-Prasinococcus_capsulatus_cf.AAC.29